MQPLLVAAAVSFLAVLLTGWALKRKSLAVNGDRTQAARKYEASLLSDYSKPPPYPIFVLVTYVMAFVHWLSVALVPAPIAAVKMISGISSGQILQTLVDLHIADALAGDHKTAAELGRELGLNVERLERLLQAGILMGVFAQIKGASGQPVKYKNNRRSATLRKDHPSSVCKLVSALSLTAKPWMSGLTKGMQAGHTTSIFETANGEELFKWMASVPERDRTFNQGMAQIDSIVAHALVVDYNWGQHTRFIDIGGCYGSLLQQIMAHWKGPEAILFDQPHVVADAKRLLKGSSMSERIKMHPGDFFDAATIPAARDGDVYLLREIMHDWTDAQCISILQNCRRGFGKAKATLLLIENIIQGNAADRAFGTRLIDIHLMAALNGAQRSKQQFEGLLSKAGFRLEKVVYTRSPFCILRCLPA